MGWYEHQFRVKRDEERGGRPREQFTLQDARRLDLLDPAASDYRAHWRYAKSREMELSDRPDLARLIAPGAETP